MAIKILNEPFEKYEMLAVQTEYRNNYYIKQTDYDTYKGISVNLENKSNTDIYNQCNGNVFYILVKDYVYDDDESSSTNGVIRAGEHLKLYTSDPSYNFKLIIYFKITPTAIII